MPGKAMNAISIIIGILALVGALVGFIPLVGWLNWLVIPVAVVGLVLGMLSDKNTGRNVNIVVLILAIVRLSIGGGIV
jgi:hypothetical protein